MKFAIKDKVKLIAPVSYLKTSDNMPMLRPPDLVAIDEIGEILSIKSLDTVEVKFRRGWFLIDIVTDPYLDIAKINKKTRIKKLPYKKIVSNLIDNIV